MASKLKAAGVEIETVDLNALTLRLRRFRKYDRRRHVNTPQSVDLKVVFFFLLDRLVKLESLVKALEVNRNGLSQSEIELGLKVRELGVAESMAELVSDLFVKDLGQLTVDVSQVLERHSEISEAFQTGVERLAYVIINKDRSQRNLHDHNLKEFFEYIDRSELSEAFESASLFLAPKDPDLVYITKRDEDQAKLEKLQTFVLRAFEVGGIEPTLNLILRFSEIESRTINLVARPEIKRLSILGLSVPELDALAAIDHKGLRRLTEDDETVISGQRWGRRDVPPPLRPKRQG